jgi:prepilin-type processing-associated H-X9-DG protein
MHNLSPLGNLITRNPKIEKTREPDGFVTERQHPTKYTVLFADGHREAYADRENALGLPGAIGITPPLYLEN